MINIKSISLLFFLTFTLQSFSQDNYSKIRLSMNLNPQLSWLNSDDDNISSGGSLFGYNFGINVNKFFAPNYAFHSGLTINTTGGILKFKPDSTTEFNLKYIEIPFGLHLKTNEFHRMVYYGQFGLATQMNINAKDEDGNSLNSEIHFFDLSYHFGGGIEYSLGGTTYLTAGVQYNNGITDITKNNDKTVLNRLVFQIGLIF
ncbi:MAG: PorT family protein [Marinilabiliaceae bacterium]|nr:PorT family protein [Marinilabiliaceae bacterium]